MEIYDVKLDPEGMSSLVAACKILAANNKHPFLSRDDKGWFYMASYRLNGALLTELRLSGVYMCALT